jgi:hypothetical protein
MGNDFSSVIRRAGVTSKIDVSNAHYMFNNAIRRIFKDNPIEYTIIANGNCNIIIKTHTQPEQYYRICFRAYLPEVTQRMIKTYNVLRERDYGIIVPPEAYITDNYVYYRINLITPLKENPSYKELYSLFLKVLPLAEHGLAWADYKPSNLGIINGKPVIIDFDCVDEEDIEDNIKTLLDRLQLNRNSENIKQWIHTHRCQCFTMNPYHLNVLFALIHGYTDPLRFMRLKFNYDLFRVKNGLKRITFNEDIYRFMLETPFALI